MNAGDVVLRLRPGKEPVPAIVIRAGAGMVKVRELESGRLRSVHPDWVVPA